MEKSNTPLFKTPYNAHLFPHDREHNDEASKTIPDQTMSIREIMERYARGLPIDGEKVPVYDGDEQHFPDLSKMDLADRQEYLENAKAELEETKARLNEKAKERQEKAAQKKAKQKDLTEEIEEVKDEQSSTQQQNNSQSKTSKQ